MPQRLLLLRFRDVRIFHLCQRITFLENWRVKKFRTLDWCRVIEGFVGINVSWNGVNLYLVNVYSSWFLRNKCLLWEGILDCKYKFVRGEWCITGDFNAVKKIIGLVVGDKDLSDHYHIWIKRGCVDWGPKSFKFFNGWTKHVDFFPFVDKCWNDMRFDGNDSFVLKEKLRLLRSHLRKCNYEVFGHLNWVVDEAVKYLNTLDFKEVCDSMVDVEALVSKWYLASKKVWSSIGEKESFLCQKAGFRWLKEDDSNSRFFHRFMKQRFRRNSILGINFTNGWIDNMVEVKSGFMNHFQHRFRESCLIRVRVSDGFNMGFNMAMVIREAIFSEGP
ncbi:unnamed protein product [Vicia faba]|uniref:Uncharacterized protein n=1 Tax=Vicia faba TaxID=3906 RepID=A0AAV1AKR3_VICFA|nr:unnamed protein product [Vicia faba]